MKNLPTGLLPRFAAAGRVLGSLGRAAASRAIRRSPEDDRQLGEALVAELDRMKGLSMKVGQILSSMDVGLPEETVAILGRLQRGAEPLPAELILSTIEAALGAGAFTTFDPVAVAAASIGQVHRARLGEREVAVKVRYPGIEATLASDTGRLSGIAGLASLATAVDGQALVRELVGRLREECDYRREAAWLGAMGRHLGTGAAGDLSVPEVIPGHSTRDVLTTAWVEGRRMEDLGADAAAAGATLLRFAWRSLLRDHFLHADPHPGNFLFPGGARVVALDWGAARRFTPAEVAPIRALLRVVTTGQQGAFRDAVVAAGIAPRPDRYDFEEGWAMYRWMWAPYLEEAGPFTFSREWSAAGHRYNGPGAKNQRHQGLLPPWIWLFRVQFGFHAALSRLGVTLDARPILAEALAAAPAPIPDPCAALEAADAAAL